MKKITFLLIAAATLGGVVFFIAPVFGHADQGTAPVFVTTIPAGFRDWRLVSVAHEAGNLNDLRALYNESFGFRGKCWRRSFLAM
jgi:hypothetical protein